MEGIHAGTTISKFHPQLAIDARTGGVGDFHGRMPVMGAVDFNNGCEMPVEIITGIQGGAHTFSMERRKRKSVQHASFINS